LGHKLLPETEIQRTNRLVAANEWKNRRSILVSQGKIDKNIINPEPSNDETVDDGAGRLLFPSIEI
jgi:hypothetical protein